MAKCFLLLMLAIASSQALDMTTLWNNTNSLCQYSGWPDDLLFENPDCPIPPPPPITEICLGDETHNQPPLILGQAVLGGVLPTSVLIILIVIIRALKLYQQRQRNLTNHNQINTTNDREMEQL